MEANSKKKISTEPYKGTRDFYPEDMFIQNYIFDAMRKTAESFGYEEYNASILENAELYRAKSGDEIINEQTYSFIDKGEREVVLRPEMTPTVARMIAQKGGKIATPIRWYSIANNFRYEKPQRGRLRDFWQLNVDIFGVEGIEAEVEIISLGYQIMKKLGAKDSDFEIKINYAGILGKVISEKFNLGKEETYAVIKLLDKKRKISAEEFDEKLKEIIGSKADAFKIVEAINSIKQSRECFDLIDTLQKNGISATFDPLLLRGFDYYTGIVFEFFDTNPENNRALFGGGRYDDLLDIFGIQKIPAIGFGMGDVTARDFMESRNLLPEYKSPADIYITTPNSKYMEKIAQNLTNYLRDNGINTTLDINYRGGAYAYKKSIPFFIDINEDSVEFEIRKAKTGDQIGDKKTKEEIVEFIKESKKNA